MAKSVFIIHDVIDKPKVRQLAIDLSLAGATVWFDEAETAGIQNFLIGKIGKEIRGDVYLAIILSKKTVGTDWVRHKLEVMLDQGVSGAVINVLPLLFEDCAISAFLADKLCADFRNPADYTLMQQKVMDSLDLGGKGNDGPSMPASFAGTWRGSWIWCGRQRDADMLLSASPAIPSRMIIRYMKSGILTIVEQELDVRISGNAVNLIGTGYRLIERGISLGWNLDTFNLSLGESDTTLEGVNTDKRGVQSPVMFKRT